MNLGQLLGLIPLAGLAAGFAKALSPRIPWLFAGLVFVVFAIVMATLGGWAATCWDCGEGATRGDAFYVGSIYFGLLALLTLLAVWLGSRLITLLQRLARTWRELRTATRR